MDRNIGTTDRIIRSAIGVALIGAGLSRRNWLGALGLYPLITGITGTCVLYKALGISTRKQSEEDEELIELFDEPVEVSAP
jgi:hypothetical protein